MQRKQKMKKTKKLKDTLQLESSHSLHGILDFMLAETVLQHKHSAKRMTIPYSTAIINPDPQYADSALVVEIFTYWDVKRSTDEHESDTEDSVRANTVKTRH